MQSIFEFCTQKYLKVRILNVYRFNRADNVSHRNEALNAKTRQKATSTACIPTIFEFSTLKLTKFTWFHKFPRRGTIPPFSAWSTMSSTIQLTTKSSSTFDNTGGKCDGAGIALNLGLFRFRNGYDSRIFP